jgi:hypothetical protein
MPSYRLNTHNEPSETKTEVTWNIMVKKVSSKPMIIDPKTGEQSDLNRLIELIESGGRTHFPVRNSKLKDTGTFTSHVYTEPDCRLRTTRNCAFVMVNHQAQLSASSTMAL